MTISSHRSPLPAKFDEGVVVIGNAEVEDRLGQFDAVVVLSVINNDRAKAEAEVEAVNVTLPTSLARAVGDLPSTMLFAFGSVHAEDPRRSDAYSLSKRRLRTALEGLTGAAIRFYVIPPIYGDEFIRKLDRVDRLPPFLRRGAIDVVGALKPLVHVDRVVEQMLREFADEATRGFVLRRIADDQSKNKTYRAVTRGVDLFLAFGVLIGFAWLVLPIALLVRAGSSGPALFRQTRVGQHLQYFTCLKFRTMRVDAPQVATHEISGDMTTPIGRWLRRWKLDELPQVLNIIVNHMSWVGPRPSLPTQTRLIEERRSRGVLDVAPGITGLSQVLGIDMSDPVRLAESDAEYLFRRSIPLYCSLLLQTFAGRGRGDRIKYDPGALMREHGAN